MKSATRPRQSIARLVPNAGNERAITPNHPGLGAAIHTYNYTNGAAPTQTPAAGNVTQATGSLLVRFNRLTIEGADVSAAMGALKAGDTVKIGTQTGILQGAPSKNGDVWTVSFAVSPGFPTLANGVYPVSSSLGAQPAGGAAISTINPLVTGPAPLVLGSVLACSTGAWKGAAPITFAYAWFRDGLAIALATAATYALAAGDLGGKSITCKVTGTNGSGSSVAESNKTWVN